MSLSNLVLPKETVLVGEGSFDVMGLSLTDLSVLVNECFEDLATLFNLYEDFEAGSPEGSDEGLIDQQFIVSAMGRVPKLFARGIALASKEPGEWEKVLSLPFPAQVEAVMAVGRLTFQGDDAVKKFMERLISILGQATDALEASSDLMAGMSPSKKT